MALQNKFLYFKNLTTFNNKLEAGDITNKHIAFIESASAIWTHGKFFYANLTDTETLLENIANAYVAKEEGKGLSSNDFTDDLKALLETVKTPMNYKGSVATKADLDNITDAQIGDVYNVNIDGMNYAWDGKAWDPFGLSALEVVNDLTTGGANVALSAEQGKELKAAIDQEIFDRNTQVAGEVERAKAAEEANATAITNERDRAEDAEKIITDNLAAEVTRATAAEDKIEASIGLATDGSYVKTDGEYTKNATSVMGAIVALEAKVKANASDIDALTGNGEGSIADQINAVKDTIDAYTINGKTISTNPVLSGADVVLTGYTTGGLVVATDTINEAINKLDNDLSWYEET